MDPLQKKMLGYQEEFRDCRDIGHTWQTYDLKVVGNELYRALRCDRCTSERRETFSKNGDLNSRVYYHADNYLLKSEDGIRYTKAFWRGLAYQQAANQR